MDLKVFIFKTSSFLEGKRLLNSEKSQQNCVESSLLGTLYFKFNMF